MPCFSICCQIGTSPWSNSPKVLTYFLSFYDWHFCVLTWHNKKLKLSLGLVSFTKDYSRKLKNTMCSYPEKWAAWFFSLIFSLEAFHLSYLVDLCKHVNSRCLLIWDILNRSGDVLKRNDSKYIYNKFKLFNGFSHSYSWSSACFSSC